MEAVTSNLHDQSAPLGAPAGLVVVKRPKGWTTSLHTDTIFAWEEVPLDKLLFWENMTSWKWNCVWFLAWELPRCELNNWHAVLQLQAAGSGFEKASECSFHLWGLSLSYHRLIAFQQTGKLKFSEIGWMSLPIQLCLKTSVRHCHFSLAQCGNVAVLCIRIRHGFCAS